MIVYLDTNFVLATLVSTHPHHTTTLETITKNRNNQEVNFIASTHTITELYATLTKWRQRLGLSVQDLKIVISELLPELASIEPLSQEHYMQAVRLGFKLQLSSGAIYDALHLACAERSGCSQLWTFNGKDFMRFAPHTRVEIVVPVVDT